ncbi:NAD(P)H-quinone oxidoreductase [Vreelandella sulfidaeris]|uniref:NAD(P)H-quinone oxidoreductase n=1 Tax=Vreelandella sulfidaeris TaxID=115553 RepID=UPI0035E7A1D3
MHAISYEAGVAHWQTVSELPSLKDNEVSIRVAWAGINRADLVQKAGHYPPPPGVTDIPGLEVSGTIIACGAKVEQFRQGDRVCALLAGGGYAEEVRVDARQVLPLPEGIGLREGAALPEVFSTAWLNLFMKGQLRKGERVLLHAGASGVGTAAMQLCNAFENPCFVTLGSEQKLARCLELGADAGWNRHNGSFVEAVNEWGGADVILDPVGGNYLADNLQVLNADGRLVLIGVMGGGSAELDMTQMLMKRQRVIGSTLRSKSPAAKGTILEALYTHVWPLLSNGKVSPLIDRTWPISEVEEAHAHMQSDASIGKVLLAISDEE